MDYDIDSYEFKYICEIKWVRLLDMFVEQVEINGKLVYRFQEIEE